MSTAREDLDVLAKEGYAVGSEVVLDNWREKFGGVFPARFDELVSPMVMAEDFGVKHPYGWQYAAWKACWRPGAMVALATCNESGKSSVVVPVQACAWAAAFPGSQAVITSNSVDQISEQLWPALRGIANRMRWQASNDKITLPSIDGMPGSTILLRVTNQGDRFEGYHNRLHTDKNGVMRFSPLLIVADEAKSISEDIFLAIERCNPCVTLYASTTGEDSGSFYEACMNSSGLWTTKQEWNGQEYRLAGAGGGIDWRQCPHLLVGNTYKRKLALIERYGENSLEVMSILLAKFYRAGQHLVFNGAEIQLLRKAMSGMIPVVRGRKKGFCDFSGGGDEMVFGYRDGNYVPPMVGWRVKDEAPSATADRFIAAFKQAGFTPERAGDIAGDNGGLGAGIISQIHAKGWKIVRVNPNTGARAKADFVDRYSEMHWDFKRLVENGLLSIEHDELLLEQATRRRYIKQNSDNGRIRVEPKKKAKERSKSREHSPDRLDVIVHLCADVESTFLDERRREVQRRLRTGSSEEFLKELREEMQSDSGNDGTMGGGWDGDNYS